MGRPTSSHERSKGRRDHSRSPMSNRRRHDGNRDAPQPSKCLGVFGLSLYTTERVNVVLDGHSGRSRGFAFLYYENVEDATEAREALNGVELDGRKIRVDYSITKRAHTPTPGMYMGRPTSSRDGGRERGGRRDDHRRRRSPSPYRRRGGRSRSRSFSPRRE